MITHLATVLEVPLRGRNELLLAAGYAPSYPETGLDEPAMDQVRHVLEFLLGAHEPYPAIVADRRWNVVMANGAATRLTSALIAALPAPPEGPANLAWLAFHPEGLRRVTVNWDAVAPSLLQRLEREVVDRAGDEPLRDLLDEVLAFPGVAELRRPAELPTGADLLLPIHYRTDDLELRLCSTIATIGAAFDVTLEELRLETFFPVDDASEATLRALSA